MNATHAGIPASVLEKSIAARNLLMAGEIDQAERIYNEILTSSPGETEATNFLSMRAIERGQFSRGINLLEQATQVKPSDTILQRGLGLAYMHAGRLDEAFGAFQKALQLDSSHYVARLLLGDVLRRMGNSHGALINYFGAITKAQLQGQWRDESTTPPWQREMVKHAMAYVVLERKELFSRVLSPIQRQHSATELRRVKEALAIYLVDVMPNYQDQRQRPTFLFFPNLPTHPYFATSKFDWVANLEYRTEAIRGELEQVLASGQVLEPFHASEPGQGQPYLQGTRGEPSWDTYFFFRHGEQNPSHVVSCPATKAALDAMPLTRIRDHAPESLFSILRPGTRILPHRGVTNTRLVVHLPLIIPTDCALVVGGESRIWEEGRTLIFDDTFEHEAWNYSDRTRAILIADIWNPYLSEAEQMAVTALIASIGDFNRDCGIT